MNFTIQRLQKSDYFNGYLQLLEQLTVVEADQITFEMFDAQFNILKSEIYTVKDQDNNIVGSASLLTEPKFIRKLGVVGHIEDVVVDNSVRGLGVGKKLIEHLVQVAKEKGCYKVILNCSDKNVGFYEKCNFIKKENEMVLYFVKRS